MKAVHLTMGICEAAGATLTIIGDEFNTKRITVRHICNVLESAMIKRKAMGRTDGVILLAEGIAAQFTEQDFRDSPCEIDYDDYGNI